MSATVAEGEYPRMQVKEVEVYINQSKNFLKQAEESLVNRNLNFAL